jgi:phosphoenolpyruvate carboxylase
VFSWSQARFYVPGWFGAGSALSELSATEIAQLAEHTRTWPFLHYVLTNIESSIASSDAELMRAYSALVEDPALRERLLGLILREWELTKTMLVKLRGASMSERRPRMQKTLQIRAEALHMLHFREIALLRKWRQHRKDGDDAGAEKMLPDLLLSINAIASGLRTTG